MEITNEYTRMTILVRPVFVDYAPFFHFLTLCTASMQRNTHELGLAFYLKNEGEQSAFEIVCIHSSMAVSNHYRQSGVTLRLHMSTELIP